MISRDKITEIFCMADDSCKLYEAGKRREGFVDMMRDSGFKAISIARNLLA